MHCKRCGLNPPDFIWVGYDHPVLVETPMTVKRVDNFEDNTMKVIAEVTAKTQMCSDWFPRVETKEVDGVKCIITHLAATAKEITEVPPRGLFVAACSGDYFREPSENDKRPRTMCEDCVQYALRYPVHSAHSVDKFPICMPPEYWENKEYQASTNDKFVTCEKCKRVLTKMYQEIGKHSEN